MTWTIDIDASTATHSSGLIIRFVPAPGVPGAFDGKLATTANDIPGSLQPLNAADLARLMREAGEAYISARNARH